MQFAFNANQYQPQYGTDGGLPDGLYKGVILTTEGKDVVRQGNVVGGRLELEIVVIEGPLKDRKMIDGLNLHNSNPQAVEIANKQLSAYCHVTGVYAFQDTNELCNKPFQFEVGRQIDKDTKQPTAFGEIKKLFDVNGNPPGKAGAGPQTQQQQPQPGQAPAAGVQPQGNGGGWGAGPGQQQQPQAQPQTQQQQPQGGQGGGWSQGGQAQPQQGQAGGGWNQAGQGGGPAPGWGAR